MPKTELMAHVGNYLAWRHDLDDCDLPLEQVAEALSGIANQAAGN
ncbi:hypothetical protein [Halomonas sp. ANAO-440]|nr:hypothetical protein [Halomonas sp. ANAO-440]